MPTAQDDLLARTAILHMPDTDESGFVMPDAERPQLTVTPAGMALPLGRIFDETRRQGGQGTVLVGARGSGKGAFIEHLVGTENATVVPPTLSADQLQSLQAGDSATLIVADLAAVDDRPGWCAALCHAAAASTAQRWLLCSESMDWVSGEQPGHSFIEYNLRVDPARSRSNAGADGGMGGGGVDYVQLPAGDFLMGSPEDEAGRWADEGPQRCVAVPAFELAPHPLTNAQYQQYLDAHPEAPLPAWWGDPRFNQDRQPVVGVTFEMAAAYCEWVGGRLPTEAEWEYACRAGTQDPRPGELNAIGWWKGNSRGRLQPVGQLQPNAWGLYDMIGNVWEYVRDDRHDSYEGAPADGSAWLDEPSRGIRLLRGGTWSDTPRVVRSATRLTHHPGPRIGSMGFRVARG
jgi:formylglycine-generating enzyme required for sulfatase activity